MAPNGCSTSLAGQPTDRKSRGGAPRHLKATPLPAALLRLCLFLHQRIHHIGRHVLVVVELHGEGATTARGRTQEVDVAEHFRQGHEALHESLRATLPLVADRAAT